MLGLGVILGLSPWLGLVLGVDNPNPNPNPIPNPKTYLKLNLTPTLTLNTKDSYFLTIFGLECGFSDPNPDPNPKPNPKTNPNPTLTLKLGSATPATPSATPLGDVYNTLKPYFVFISSF